MIYHEDEEEKQFFDRLKEKSGFRLCDTCADIDCVSRGQFVLKCPFYIEDKTKT